MNHRKQRASLLVAGLWLLLAAVCVEGQTVTTTVNAGDTPRAAATSAQSPPRVSSGTAMNHTVGGSHGSVATGDFSGYGKLPLSFEPNQGQTDERVKFLSHGRGYGLFLTGNEAVLTLHRVEGRKQQAKTDSRFRGNDDPRTTDPGRRIADDGPRPPDSILRMRLVHANQNASVTGLEELPGKANYFLGNDPEKWRTNVPTYAHVRYQNIYPGIDLVYYGNQGGQLEYDFVVAPGADPSSILLAVDVAGQVGSRLKAVGSKPSRIDSNGDLVLKSGVEDIRFRKPARVSRSESEVGGHESEVLATANLKFGIVVQSSIGNRPSSIVATAGSFLTPRTASASRWVLTTTPGRWLSTPCWLIPPTWAAAALTKATASLWIPPATPT